LAGASQVKELKTGLTFLLLHLGQTANVNQGAEL
jgi:hypothetical protein